MPTRLIMLLFTFMLFCSTNMLGLYMLVSEFVIVYILKLIIKLFTFLNNLKT
jgi:hypothetical protein